MNIAVDARELSGRPTGVGRYLGELLTEWAESPAARQHRWTLYAHQPLSVPAPFAGQVRVLSGTGGTRWEQWTLAQALAAEHHDVLFAPAYTSPLRARCPVVQTIHDVSFAAHPEWFRFREGARRRVMTRLSAARARVILTDSAFSRDEIVRHLGVPAARVRVIPLGIRSRWPSRAPQSQPPRAPVVLFVGSIFRRRHVDALIRAFAEAVIPRVPNSRLEIVGDNRAYPPLNLPRVVTLLPLEAQRRITIRSYVPEETLAALYSSASVFAFPSEYEGFGLTPLEALAAGVVPLVLDTPVASEIYGAAARYVPFGTGGLEARLGEALVHLLTSQTARDDILRHAPDRLARYRWDKTAAATLREIEENGRG